MTGAKVWVRWICSSKSSGVHSSTGRLTKIASNREDFSHSRPSQTPEAPSICNPLGTGGGSVRPLLEIQRSFIAVNSVPQVATHWAANHTIGRPMHIFRVSCFLVRYRGKPSGRPEIHPRVVANENARNGASDAGE